MGITAKEAALLLDDFSRARRRVSLLEQAQRWKQIHDRAVATHQDGMVKIAELNLERLERQLKEVE